MSFFFSLYVYLKRAREPRLLNYLPKAKREWVNSYLSSCSNLSLSLSFSLSLLNLSIYLSISLFAYHRSLLAGFLVNILCPHGEDVNLNCSANTSKNFSYASNLVSPAVPNISFSSHGNGFCVTLRISCMLCWYGLNRRLSYIYLCVGWTSCLAGCEKKWRAHKNPVLVR